MASVLETSLDTLSLDESYLLVAAIDVGTTFSAYAFSFKSAPDEIKMNKNWGANIGCETYKVPTCVMTNPDGNFHSFGYEAELQYSELDEAEDTVGGPNGYNLYRNFKMMLHTQEAKMTSTVTSVAGHMTRAIDIFSMTIKYLKDHMMDTVSQTVTTPIEAGNIRWVLTVPAIWTDESKRFMREAACMAGLIPEVDSKQLLIALEPEAASVFCRQVADHSATTTSPDSHQDAIFKAGDKILIVDAGGGTVDITAHEVQVTGQVREIAPPSGGPWGGTVVDKKFISVINKVAGSDFINSFKVNYSPQWLQFRLHVEKAKKSVQPDDPKGKLRVQIPYSFNYECEKYTGKDIINSLKDSQIHGLTFNNGFFVFKQSLVEEIYKEPVEKIISCVQALMESYPQLEGLGYILLVGGFGESKFLQVAFKKAFGDRLKIITHMDAQLAVIKGAVMFGHNPLQITSRISKMTYGCDTWVAFDENIHSQDKKVMTEDDGKHWAMEVFHVFVTCGEDVKLGSQKTITFKRVIKDQKTMSFHLFKTQKRVPVHTDEEGVQQLGVVTVSSKRGPIKKVELCVTFGHTELLIEAQDIGNRDRLSVQQTVDFLSD